MVSSSVYSNERKNPFLQPEPPKPKVVETSESKMEDQQANQIELINNVVGTNLSRQDPMANAFPEINQFIAQGFQYRGSINGVDIYFNPTTKRYVRDRENIMQITDLNTDLPPMEQVNY